jgi:hypothetical protein
MNVNARRTPVFGAVRGGFERWRAALLRIWATVIACGALTAGASFAMVRFAEANIGLYLLSQMLFFAIFSYAYAAQLAAALDMTQDPRRGVMDALRVFAAISVLSFFLFIVFFAAFIPGAFIVASFFPPSLADLQAAEGDPAASMRLAERMLREHWQPMLALGLLYGAIWMFLTSRLYLAAPASVAQERVRTFETWAWTKGEAWRISAARLLLLLPVWFVLTLLQAGLSAALGAGAFDPGAMQALMTREPLKYLALLAPMQVLSLLVYSGLEAGLSAHLYQRLQPATV